MKFSKSTPDDTYYIDYAHNLTDTEVDIKKFRQLIVDFKLLSINTNNRQFSILLVVVFASRHSYTIKTSHKAEAIGSDTAESHFVHPKERREA